MRSSKFSNKLSRSVISRWNAPRVAKVCVYAISYVKTINCVSLICYTKWFFDGYNNKNLRYWKVQYFLCFVISWNKIRFPPYSYRSGLFIIHFHVCHLNDIFLSWLCFLFLSHLFLFCLVGLKEVYQDLWDFFLYGSTPGYLASYVLSHRNSL